MLRCVKTQRPETDRRTAWMPWAGMGNILSSSFHWSRSCVEAGDPAEIETTDKNPISAFSGGNLSEHHNHNPEDKTAATTEPWGTATCLTPGRKSQTEEHTFVPFDAYRESLCTQRQSPRQGGGWNYSLASTKIQKLLLSCCCFALENNS